MRTEIILLAALASAGAPACGDEGGDDGTTTDTTTDTPGTTDGPTGGSCHQDVYLSKVEGEPPVSLAGARFREAVVFGDASIVVGDGGLIARFDDVGLISVDSGVSVDLHGVGWNGETLIAVGDGGTILRSTDGVAWHPVASGVTSDLYAVAFNAADSSGILSTFAAVGEDTFLVGGPEGESWAALEGDGPPGPLRTLAGVNDTFVATGTDGRLLVFRTQDAAFFTAPGQLPAPAVAVLSLGVEAAFYLTDGTTWQAAVFDGWAPYLDEDKTWPCSGGGFREMSFEQVLCDSGYFGEGSLPEPVVDYAAATNVGDHIDLFHGDGSARRYRLIYESACN